MLIIVALEIILLGGYSEVGRNSVAIKVDDEIFILDFGLMIDKFIEYTEREEYEVVEISGKKLIEIGAAPDINILGKEKKNVKAILITHAHLDHIGAIPYLAKRFKAPIYATPFTIEIIKSISNKLPNKLIPKKTGKFSLTKKVKAEFIHVTHSTPQTVIIVLETPYGKVVYANDFKFDEHPTKGKPTDYNALKKHKNAKVLIMDSLYASKNEESKSENHVRALLFNKLKPEVVANKKIIATTFSSHIYRLQTLLEIAEKMNRTPVFLGRSLDKYMSAAEKLKIASFKKAKIIPYARKIKSFLKKINNYENYFFITTGNQGEPKAVLSRIVNEELIDLKKDDLVIFSCITIPVEPNITFRKELEEKLKNKKIKILKDIHVSGHASKPDHKKLLNLIKPEIVIPTHGDLKALFSLKKTAMEEGFKKEQIKIVKTGERLKIL